MLLSVLLFACSAEVEPPRLRPSRSRKSKRPPTPKPEDRGKQKGRKSKGKGKSKPAPDKGPVIDKQCTVGAYLTHGDKPVTLFTKPDKSSAKAGSVSGDHHYTHFEVKARQGGWMRVTDVDVRIPKGDAEGGPLDLKGWLERKEVSIYLEGCYNGAETLLHLYTDPDLASEVVQRYPDGAAQAKVVGCSGDWWRVRDGDGHEGWVPKGMWCDHAQTNCLKQCKDLKK